MREIEIKFRVKDLEDIEGKLKKQKFLISKNIKQHDVVYSDGKLDYSTSSREGIVAVRIRHQDNIALLTVKKQMSNEMDNIEYETEVSDAKAVDKMLLLLGWRPEVEVIKNRRKGKLGEYEICLDEVESLGSFIEIEKMADDGTNPEKVRAEILKTAEKLGISKKDEETRGYDTQIYQLKNLK